ncbi:MAG: hypothetical protein SOW78_05155, partial [Clostridia bacterium]|nr:hypothetical protein [Clostridia bacterium]
ASMPNITDTKENCVCLYQKKKDIPTPFAILEKRLFPCHFISIHSCASTVMKWFFYGKIIRLT